MEPHGTGWCPPLCFTSYAVGEMLENLNNYSDSDCLLSDDDDPPYARSRSSSNSSSNGSETDHDYAGLNLSIAIAERCPQHRVKDKVDPTMKNKINLDLDLR